MSVATFTKTGTKATTPAKLDKSVFGVKPKNHELLKSAYVAYMANGRTNLAVTKTRGLVVGSTKKPHRQKGTGRARAGSRYNPIWRGGGITFGPTGNENYTHKLPLKQKRVAIRQALTVAANDNRIMVVETFSEMNKDKKTKNVVKFLDKIGAKGRILCVVSERDETAERSTNNIPKLKVVSANYLNVYDILNADNIVISKKSLDIIHEWLGGSK